MLERHPRMALRSTLGLVLVVGLAVACEEERPAEAPTVQYVAAQPAVTTPAQTAYGTAQPAYAFASTTSGYGCPPSALAGHYHDLSAILEPIRQRHNLPALGAAIVTPDGIDSLGVVGVRRYGTAVPACPDDTWHLGSDTKAMTATMIARLVEMNKLSWNTTIGSIFSDVPMNPGWSQVTLEHLLAHKAGFSHDLGQPGYLRSLVGTMRQQREAFLRAALAQPPKFDLGHYRYSNTGYIVAGIMAERATGKPWEVLMQELIFQPLGMSRAGFGLNTPPGTVDGLVGHHIDGSGTPIPVDDPGVLPVAGPAGTEHASFEDWGKFLSDMLRGFEGRGSLLQPATYAYLHTPKLGGKYAYGWGYKNAAWAGGPFYFHEGTNTMNLALAWVLPMKKVAVMIGTNVGPKGIEACKEAKAAVMHARLGIVLPGEPDVVEGEHEAD